MQDDPIWLEMPNWQRSSNRLQLSSETLRSLIFLAKHLILGANVVVWRSMTHCSVVLMRSNVASWLRLLKKSFERLG